LKHEGATAPWAGNSPTVVQKHYRALVTEGAAAEFWSTVPQKQKIVALPVVEEEAAAANR
jgi:hypothetical protein